MKVPLSWLNEFIELTISADKIAEILTLAGLEVDAVSPMGNDTLFEISLTPNLGHCMSIFGIARELSAHLKKPLKKPFPSFKEDDALNIHDLIKVDVKDEKNAPRYSCRAIKNIKVSPSPDWLKNRLELCGLKSKNILVDISNYVMLEFGEPLHIFDYDTIADKNIIVSSNTSYKEIEALDDKTYKIEKDTLLICDPQKPLAIAGIIGGKSSAVTGNTKNILIESASFSESSIRKSAKKMGIRTDASQRFEKGVDPEGVLYALDRAVELIQKEVGGNIAKGIIDKKAHPFLPKAITLRAKRVNQILGTHLNLEEIKTCLERLEIQCQAKSEDTLTAFIPTYRFDITEEIDLIEEVARVYGYNHIPKKSPHYTSSTLPSSAIYLFENEARKELISLGLNELLTCDLISEELAKLCLERGFTEENLVRVLSPSSIDQSVLRASMLPGLLQVVKYNVDHQNANLHGFELGKIHFKEKEHFKEHACIGIVLTGMSTAHHYHPKPREVDFFDLKGKIETLLQELSNKKPHFEVSHFHHLHPGRQAKILIEGCLVGVLGEVHPREIKAFDIGKRVFFAEINLSDLFLYKKQVTQITQLSSYPASERDWTFNLKENLPLGYILEAVEEQKNPLLEKVMLLDLYKSEQIGKDSRNITLRFVYRDSAKTIAFETVEKQHASIITKVKEKFPNI